MLDAIAAITIARECDWKTRLWYGCFTMRKCANLDQVPGELSAAHYRRAGRYDPYKRNNRQSLPHYRNYSG
jgi:hypothetical protein